jgi:hypothetical protein
MEIKTSIFKNGTVNNPKDPELVPRGGASESLGWITKGAYIQLSYGKLLIGAEETASGSVKGEHFGYKIDGTPVHFRKVNTKIQYYNTATELWVDVITGLTSDAQYTFADHHSLVGSFVYISGYDGLFKINLANPGSYKNLSSATKNFLHPGKILISDSRMFMWGLPDDKTGLYLSYIDAQNYTTVTAESVGTGDGSTLTFTDTLNAISANAQRFAFAVVAASPVAAVKNVSAVTKAVFGQVTTSAAHGLSVNDYVVFNGLGGMTELNSRIARVTGVIDATNFQIDIDTTSFTNYTAGGTVGKAERFTDDNNGTLTGNLGGTGTINYATGAISLTFSTAPISGQPVVAEYQHENSTASGVADFTYSTPRQAAQGDLFRQDDGGDAIQNVEVFDGRYYSLKERSVYELDLTADDTNATNKVFRKGIGMPYFRASVSTGQGIVFMDTADPDYPKLTRLERNLTGDGVLPIELAPQFDFSDYEWDKCAMGAWGDYIVFSGRTPDSTTNNRLFLYSLRWKSIDVCPYSAATFAKDAGLLYIGDSITDNVYNVFSGFDDDGYEVENEWTSGADLLDSEEYKKVKRLTLEGDISREQSVEVYISLDNDSFTLLGTIDGTGSYVETSNPHTIGSVMNGVDEVGGGGDGIDVYSYFTELKINTGKFYRRRLKFKATGIGYASVSMIKDKDIYQYGDKIPKKYRTN